MKNSFTTTDSILLNDGNIKKSMENYFNYYLRKLNDDNQYDLTCQCTSKIVLEQPESVFTDKFNFTATITWTDLASQTDIFVRKIVGIGKCLSPQMKYHRKNILVDTYIRIEWQMTAMTNTKGEFVDFELAPYELLS